MTWFWIITLSWSSPRGQASATVSGTINDEAAQLLTRNSAYLAVVAEARRALELPEAVTAPVLFFSLEPDALAAPRAELALAGGAS